MNLNVRGLAVGPTLPGSPPAALALLGDVLVLLVFVAMGISNHGGAPLESPVYTLERVAPFLLSWVVVAPLAGVYHRETLTGYRRTVVLVTAAWVVVALGGSALRGSSLFPGGAPLPFVLVTLSFGTAMVLSWRVAGVWLRRRFG
jgi:hypothetical protein